MSSTRNSNRRGSGNMYHPNIVSPMSYFNPIGNMSAAGYATSTAPLPHGDAIRSAGVPSRCSSSSSPSSIEDMHRDYVNNKAELTKHISTAAGAVEQLWGGDGWFMKWYEMPSQSEARGVNIPTKNGVTSTSGRSRASKNTIKKSEAAQESRDLIVLPHGAPRSEVHNLVEHVNIPSNVSSGAVKKIISRFGEQRNQFSWVIGPQEQPVLEALLRNEQLWCEEIAPTLSADLNLRDDLFCEAKSPSPGLTPDGIEDSATLPSPERFDWNSRPDRSFEQPELLSDTQALWMNRRQSSLHRVTRMPEMANKVPRPQYTFQIPSGLVQSANQAQGRRQQPAVHGTTIRTSEASEAMPLETTVGSFEKLSIGDATPNHADRIRTIPDGTILHLLNDKSEVEEWVRTWAHEAEPSPSGAANIQHWTSIYTNLIETLPTNQFRMFAARKSSTNTHFPPSSSATVAADYRSSTDIIGTGYVHLFSGVASVHCITVLPAYRAKGVGSALTRYAMGLGKDMGYATAMLTASMSSSPSTRYGAKAAMFSPLGFKEFGRVKLYVYRPLRETEQTICSTKETDKIREAEDDGWEWVGEEEDDDNESL
ncbi:hypothetical protein Micbo1qcDRAFT_159601 [Microdochium bolleyi]|uniref:N-acetyltransferase domain-containing protein n=1 Tax=Microdochium bolleyi TaxID=196109 RepID=A0A136JBF7_9PEZI|nr:hypothetical protein Micbo1qcDRAFT_159601 [Microdochium bolleyi]